MILRFRKIIFPASVLYKLAFIMCLFAAVGVNPAIAQNNDGSPDKVAAAEPKKDYSGVKEELQRYMGYESLPVRYLSLPYDTTMNTNVTGSYMEIGYLLFIFVPIILLLGFRDRPLAGSLIMLGAILLLSISVKHSTILGPDKIVLQYEEAHRIFEETTFAESPVATTTAVIYQILGKLSPPKEFFKNLSTDEDGFTYPLLVILFIGIFYLLQKRIEHHDIIIRALLNFTLGFSFLYLLLASGIIWYGYLMIAIGFLILAIVFDRYLLSDEKILKFSSYVFLGISGFWIVLTMINRSVNYRYDYTTVEASKQIFDKAILKYQIGEFNADQTIDAFFPGSVKALNMINSDDALVFRVGTIFNYYIKKNDKRVLHDSQCDNFNNITKNYSNKITIAEGLIANGYKYLLVDLNTHVIDKTPEKTLTNKFNLFLNFLYENPRVELIATNRLLRSQDDPNRYYQGLFGDVYFPGSYAFFQLK